MPRLSKEEQELIDRLRASGHPAHGKQSDAPFKFLVRPLTTVGVSSLDLASSCENAIFEAVRGIAFDSPITGIVISPKIFDESVAEAPEDSLTYKEVERSVFVSLGIDLATWERASRKEKLHLLVENIKRSVGRIPSAYLSQPESEKLLVAIDGACAHLERGVLH